MHLSGKTQGLCPVFRLKVFNNKQKTRAQRVTGEVGQSSVWLAGSRPSAAWAYPPETPEAPGGALGGPPGSTAAVRPPVPVTLARPGWSTGGLGRGRSGPRGTISSTGWKLEKPESLRLARPPEAPGLKMGGGASPPGPPPWPGPSGPEPGSAPWSSCAGASPGATRWTSWVRQARSGAPMQCRRACKDLS